MPRSFPISIAPNKIALWAITPQGAELAGRLAGHLPGAALFLSAKLKSAQVSATGFTNLAGTVRQMFAAYDGHIFIMSTGIVVRLIAEHIRHKTVDPAVVVMDERGRHAISLLAGHIGGGNRLAQQAARISGAEAVITTATDVNRLPAVDVLALEHDLQIENPDALKGLNMAIVSRREILLHDPFEILTPHLTGVNLVHWKPSAQSRSSPATQPATAVFIDDVSIDLCPQVLILRPKSLAVGVGCNRGTSFAEIAALLEKVIQTNNLSAKSVRCLATIDLKQDETGLRKVSEALKLPLLFFSRSELNQVKTIQTPSAVVEKHIGVKSVCEAAAILAARMGPLVIPKQSTPNATLAVARISFTS